jgi:hypothetical protein
MKKYRIVEVIPDSGNKERKSHWVIEEKKFFGWKEIKGNEGPKLSSVIHLSYKDAKLYLLNNYTGHGECRKCGNVYTYIPYVYYV